MAKKSLWQSIKDFFTGGSGSSGSGSSSSRSSSSRSSGSSRRSSSGSYYGGGYSSSYRSSREDEKKKRRREIEEKNKQTTAKLAAIAKVSQRTDALSSGKKALPPEPKKLANNGVERAVKKIGEKSQSTDPKVEAARALKEKRDKAHAEGSSLLRNNLNELKSGYEKDKKAYHEATGHRYDVNEEGISKEEKAERRRAQKSRMYDLDAELYETEAHPIAASFGRGALSGVTLGASELALQKSKARQESGAEEFYQTHKNRGAEIAGTFAGGLLSYGGTAGAFENLGARAVGKAATTQVGKRLGAEALQRTMAGEGFKAAIARSLVGDAIQDSTMGLFDTMTDVARRDDLETAGDYAKAIAQGQALNYGMGLAGNGLMHGLPVAGRAVGNAWGNFVDESRRLYAVPKGIAEAGEEIGGNINKATGIDLSKGHTEEERTILKARYNEVKAQANKLEALSSSAEPIDRKNLLMAAESLRAEAGSIELALKRSVGEPARFVDVEALEAERAAKKAEEREKLAENAKSFEETSQTTTEKSAEMKRHDVKRPEPRSAEEQRAELAKEKAERKAKYEAENGVVASGKNMWTGEKLEFWKENGKLYVGNPKGKYKSFGRDLPENRIKAEDEFDNLNYTKKQRFKEERKKAERAEAKAKAAKEKPERPANVSYFSDKELKAMEKKKDFSKLTKAEYEYYFPDRKIELDFGGDEEAVAKGVKSKEAQDNLEELILEGKESRTFTKNQLEKKISKSNKRLAELEEQIKKNSNASQWTQDKLSAQYESQLSYNKRIRELLEQAKSSEDGKVTTYRNKSNYVKKTAEEPEVTTTKAVLEPKGKSKKGKGKKGEAKADADAKAEAKPKETEVKAEEAKAEPEKEAKPKLTKAEKDVKSLQNKVDNAEAQVKRIDKELKKKRKEGASEKSIEWWENQRAEAAAKRTELKAELRKAKKELGVESKPQDAALKSGGKEPPEPIKAEATKAPKPEDFDVPADKRIKKLKNQIENSENNIRRFDEAIEKKKAEGASEKSIAWSENAKARELEKKAGFEEELRNVEKELEAEPKIQEPTPKEEKPPKKTSTDTKKSEKTEAVEEATAQKEPKPKLTKAEKDVNSFTKKVANAEEQVKKYDKLLKEAKKDGASENKIANLENQLKKAKDRRKDLKAELKNANKALEAEKKAGVIETSTEAPKKAPQDKALKENGKKPPKAKKDTKTKAPKLNEDGYASVEESPLDVGKNSSKANTKNKKTVTAETKVKGAKKAASKLKNKGNTFKRNAPPRGEWVHRSVYKDVTGKEVDEALNPPTFKDYIEAKKTYEKGQASGEKEVVSRAGTSLMNATTADAQREFLRKGWQDGDFTYRKIKNKQKYEEVMKRWVDEPEAVARDIIRYNDELSSELGDRAVDMHYQAHCVMKMLRKELDNPALSDAEREAVKEIYSSAASVTQKLSSTSGQINQFQGVMVHCTPVKRSDNALDNIASILDSSRGYRKNARITIDGVEKKLSDNKATRMQQIKSLLLENEDVQKNLEKVYNATTEEEYGDAMSDLLLSTYKLNHATGFDYIQQWRYLSMLGNPKTHLRNLIGNVTFGTLRNMSNTVRTIEEKALGNYAARHGLEIDYHGGLSPKAWRQARFKKFADDDASKKAWEYFEKHEKQILGAQKYDSPELAAGFRHLAELNTKILGAEDDLFRAPAYREQFIKSYNKFAKKGEITDDILERIHREALKESQIATFNELSELAQVLASSQRGLYDANASAGKKLIAFGSNALLPFTKVPANILKQSVNYSPVGAIKGITHILDAAKQGDSALFNKALDELASGITGTGIAALGYYLGKHTDWFTTNAGSEDAAAKYKKQQGVQNYSATVNLPNGKTYSFTLDWLVPASCTFFTGVETANQLKNGLGGANIFEAGSNLSQVMSRMIDPVLETSMLSSIYNIVENSRKSNSYDDQQSFANIALRELVQSYLSSFVPTFQGQIARSFVYDADKMVTGEDDWEYWTNSLKVKMGLAETDIFGDRLGDDTNAYGEVKNKKEGFGDKAWSFVKNGVLPTNIQEVSLTDTDKQKIKEYEDYVAAGGDPADKEYLFPKKQYRKNFTVGKKGADPLKIDLSNEQVSLYNQAKTTGGAEGMRAVLEGAMFNHYDKDSSGKRTILKNGYTKEQKEALISKFEGKSMREVEEWLYKQPQFRSATEEEQRKVLNALWSYSQGGKAQGAKRVGEQAVIKAQGGDLDEYNFKNELSKAKQLNLQEAVDSGLVTYAEAVDFARNAGKTYYYDNDEGGSSSTYYNKKQMIEYLQSKGYSYEKAEALYNAFKSSNAKAYNGSSSSSGGRGRYRGRRSGGGGGGSAKASVPAPKKITASSFIKGQALVGRRSGSSSRGSSTPTLKRVEAKIDLPTDKYLKKNRR